MTRNILQGTAAVKQAAPLKAKAGRYAKRLMELLSGSKVKRLEQQMAGLRSRGAQAQNVLNDAIEDAKRVMRRNPLRSQGFSAQRGSMDLVPPSPERVKDVERLNMLLNPSDRIALQNHYEQLEAPFLDRVSRLGDREAFLWRTKGRLADRIAREAKRVRAARIGAGAAVGVPVAGLGVYGGSKLLGDKQVNDKTAEAVGNHMTGGTTMTSEQAYTAGFCKAAEVIGVDPVALYKRAGGDYARRNTVSEVAGMSTVPLLAALLARNPAAGAAVGKLANGGGFLASLATDTRSAAEQTKLDNTSQVLKNLLIPGRGAYSIGKRIGSTAHKKAEAGSVKQALSLGDAVSWAPKLWARFAQSRAGQAAAKGGRRYMELLRGGAGDAQAFAFRRPDLKNIRGYLQTYWQGLKGDMGAPVAGELRKALAARAGTGAAATAGVAAGASMLGGGGQQPEAGTALV